MFLSELSKDQKIAFHNIAIQLIYYDDILDTAEAGLIKNLDFEMGLLGKKIPSNDVTEELLKLFDTKKSKIILLIELILIGNIDNEYSVEESEFIKQLAESLSISQIELMEMESWVFRKLSIDKEARRLME